MRQTGIKMPYALKCYLGTAQTLFTFFPLQRDCGFEYHMDLFVYLHTCLLIYFHPCVQIAEIISSLFCRISTGRIMLLAITIKIKK